MLSVTITQAPGSGSLVDLGSGQYRYTPSANFYGADTLRYTVSDGQGGMISQQLVLTINSVNDAPEVADLSLTLQEDTLVMAALLALDVDGPSISFVIVQGPAHGSVMIVDGKLIYAPTADYNGPDSFTYKATDGLLDSNIATVSLTVTPVNDAPVSPHVAITLAEDTTATFRLRATDVDGDALSYEIVEGPQFGTLQLVDGVITYRPNADFNGLDSFVYRAW